MAGRAGCRPLRALRMASAALCLHATEAAASPQPLRLAAGTYLTPCVPGACQPLCLECASRMVSATPHTYATGAAATAAIIVPCQPPRPAANFAPPALRPHSRCSCLHSAAPASAPPSYSIFQHFIIYAKV